MSILNFIKELKSTNSSNEKLKILKLYSNDKKIMQLLKLTYDRINFNYHCSRKTVEDTETNQCINCNIDDALDLLETYCSEIKTGLRKQGGIECAQFLKSICNSFTDEAKEVFLNIIHRDLKCNINARQINKVFKNLIPKPHYMRCDVYSKKNAKKINFPAIIQLKMDGTYREFRVEDGNVTSKSRSGEEYYNPVLMEQFKILPNGYYIGELTIEGDSRFIGNGLINSDNPPYNDIIFTMWDYLTFDDYNLTTATCYSERFEALKKNVKGDNLRIVESYVVNTLEEALKHVNTWMTNGLEGGVLKDLNNTFKDGTSKTQLKIKLAIDADVRITGFSNGSKGTKREGKIGAIQYQTDDGKVKGQCSGFTDEQLDDFTKNKDSLIGKIMAVQFNDLSKAQNNDYYALSHPRFIEIRTDKTETDTYERILQLKKMAMELE